jgi:2-phosphoglycerate kinase
MSAKNPYGIMVTEEGNNTPFSRGILASSISEIGLNMFDAYGIAHRILQSLQETGIHRVDSSNIRRLVSEEIEKIDSKASKRYLFSRKQKHGSTRKETIILIGGASGVGTTTTAYEIASRLNIKHIVGTDTIREIMRMMISPKLSPELHLSTFNASEESSIPIPQGYDPSVFGFQRQASLVTVGVEAVVNRALKEGHDLVVEGAHIVPGYMCEDIVSRDRTFTFLLTIEDADTHRKRFTLRSLRSDLKRPAEHYLNYLDEIRKIHDYLKAQAEEFGFSVIENENSDYSVEVMLDGIFSTTEQGFKEI